MEPIVVCCSLFSFEYLLFCLERRDFVHEGLEIKKKLVVAGSILTVIPLLIIYGVVSFQNNKMLEVAGDESLKRAFDDFQHIVEGVYTLAESHQEVTEKNIASFLRVAEELIHAKGGVGFTEGDATWSSVNQYTKSSSEVELPKMAVGTTWLGQVSDLSEQVLVVDKVRDLTGVTCTIFQRMNPDGDMLRVATNVIKKRPTGHRDLYSGDKPRWKSEPRGIKGS